MYKFKGMQNDLFKILDTDDDVLEAIDGATVRQLMSGGIEIEGLYFNDNGDIENAFGDILLAMPKVAKNRNLSKAKKAKNDEFYTQLVDIEKELSNYPPETFKDKVIYCPMDVATTQGAILRSEFVHYFQMHAHEFQFKELIATCLHDKSTGEGYADEDVRSNNYHLVRREVSYATEENKASGKSPIAEVKGDDGRLYYKYIDGRMELIPDNVVNEAILDTDGNLIVETVGTPQLYTYQGYFRADCKADEGFDSEDVEGSNKAGKYGSGDFRSAQCKRYLEQCDIVVTNPPFSLFREFIVWVINADKKFITLADQNIITYKEVFPLIRDNKMWVGTQTGIISLMFEVPEHYPVPAYAEDYCKKHVSSEYFKEHRLTYIRGISWFTNVDLVKRHEFLVGLSKSDYESQGIEYTKYDNYDAINVDKVNQIPLDYDGVMGVPITFLYKYCPEQFEIVAFRKGDDGKDLVFTRERESSTLLSYPCTTSIPGMIKNAEGKINGKPTYARITIRRKSLSL